MLKHTRVHIGNYINRFLRVHRSPNFSGGLTKLPPKIGLWLVITRHLLCWCNYLSTHEYIWYYCLIPLPVFDKNLCVLISNNLSYYWGWHVSISTRQTRRIVVASINHVVIFVGTIYVHMGGAAHMITWKYIVIVHEPRQYICETDLSLLCLQMSKPPTVLEHQPIQRYLQCGAFITRSISSQILKKDTP